MIGQHEADFRVSRLLRNREDLTDAAYVEKNPTITGTSLESLNIYHISIFEHHWFQVQTLDLNRIFIEIPLVSAPVPKSATLIFLTDIGDERDVGDRFFTSDSDVGELRI